MDGEKKGMGVGKKVRFAMRGACNQRVMRLCVCVCVWVSLCVSVGAFSMPGYANAVCVCVRVWFYCKGSFFLLRGSVCVCVCVCVVCENPG